MWSIWDLKELVTWRDILIMFNATILQLQTADLNLNTSVKLIESPTVFTQNLQGQFSNYEEIAIQKYGHS